MATRSRPPPGLVPKWLENLAALGWRVFVIAALLVVLWLLASVLWVVTASILVAIVIAAFFAPYALRLRARGRSRTAAAAIVWVVALAIVGGALLLLGAGDAPVRRRARCGTWTRPCNGSRADLAALNIPPVVANGRARPDRRHAATSPAGSRARSSTARRAS